MRKPLPPHSLVLGSMLMTIAIVGLLSESAFCQDTSDGIVWYPPVLLSDPSTTHFGAKIALTGDDTVHIIWEGDPYTRHLPYRRSLDGGMTFEPERDLLGDSSAFPEQAHYPNLLANGNMVYVFFTNPEPEIPPVPHDPFTSPERMVRSTDGGQTFDRGRNITTQKMAWFTSVAISGDTIAGIINTMAPDWEKIFYTTNRGETWTMNTESVNQYAQVALTPGRLHYLGETGFPIEQEYRQSTNLGRSWTYTTILSTVDNYFSDLSNIAASSSKCGDEIMAVWRDMKYGWGGIAGASIISRTGLNDGRVWLKENVLTGDIPLGTEPRPVINKNIRAVGWCHEMLPTMYADDVIRASNKSVTHLSTEKDLALTTWVYGAGDPPAVAVSSHAIHVVTSAAVDSTFRIYYRRGEFLHTKGELALGTGILTIDTAEVGTDHVDSISVSNVGVDPVEIGDGICPEYPEEIWADTTTIAPMSSGKIAVHLKPRTEGVYRGKIILYHSGKSSPDCFMVEGTSRWHHEIRGGYQAGEWNLVSCPLSIGGPAPTTAYSYNGTRYLKLDTLRTGVGYWMRLESDSLDFLGGHSELEAESTQVYKGWNMIGSGSMSVDVNSALSLPPGMITSRYYTWNGNNYTVADSVHPGRGYWVKVNEDGMHIFMRNLPLFMKMANCGKTKIVPSGEEPPPPPSTPPTSFTGKKSPIQVRRFGLDQNYPNPFNPVTSIHFRVEQPGVVQLKIYNIYGSEVAVLVNESISPGEYTREWNASGLPSGIYIYRLVENGKTLTRKATLVR